ncbi:MAG: hypothetical protein JEZ11_20315 [Desulfobacterales bacterium]|nr:hypothetical protein [Desulfobacterales bacterium]
MNWKIAIPGGDLLCVSSVTMEITNIKSQISNNIQRPKFEKPNNVPSRKALGFENWDLEFVWHLVLGIFDFSRKASRHRRLTLTTPTGFGFPFRIAPLNPWATVRVSTV